MPSQWWVEWHKRTQDVCDEVLLKRSVVAKEIEVDAADRIGGGSVGISK